MRVVVFYGQNQPHRVGAAERPRPGRGEVLPKAATSDTYRTDPNYIYHGVPITKKPLLVLGHGLDGVVGEIREGFEI
ncbi:MAG: hypothetical protein QME66_12445 [Candidatus Eisenbacteria bacterium]|nr:hypothetical protein [Candidatus Eisenbacteria bacterium]